MNEEPYRLLAQRLDSLPNGFPATDDGSELRLLACLFTPEEAALAARLRLKRETAEQIAARIEAEPGELAAMLKSMAKRGLIAAGRSEGGLGYGLMPFVVGIYEMQIGRIDAELARLFEDYYRKVFGEVLRVEPSVHRVVPVGESVRVELEIQPYESVSEIVAGAQAWGVLDCICRVQKALVGEPCEHPVDVCMTLGSRPGMFDNNPVVRALTQEEALATLQRAAQAGLVHSVSNNQRGIWYICNCCTCSCGILRGISEMGIANAVARSPFINQVDEDLCIACEDCLEYCQFGALSLDMTAQVDELRCVGCGVCVPACPEGALSLARRPQDEIQPVPETDMDWMQARAASRGIDIHQVL
jgi:ferredoxin